MKQVLLLPSSRIESHPIQLLTRRSTPSAMSALLIKAQCLLYVQFLVPIYFALTRYTLRMIKFVCESDFLFRKKLYLISRLEIRRALDIAKKYSTLCTLCVYYEKLFTYNNHLITFAPSLGNNTIWILVTFDLFVLCK